MNVTFILYTFYLAKVHVYTHKRVYYAWMF